MSAFKKLKRRSLLAAIVALAVAVSSFSLFAAAQTGTEGIRLCTTF